jgi:hypothetical protein
MNRAEYPKALFLLRERLRKALTSLHVHGISLGLKSGLWCQRNFYVFLSPYKGNVEIIKNGVFWDVTP